MAKKVDILAGDLDYANIFPKKLAKELSERFDINKHLIDLEKSNHLLNRLIYNLSAVELKTFKTYIKTKLAKSFIWLSNYLVGVLILFVKKPNVILLLCFNYQGFNNLTIKN